MDLKKAANIIRQGGLVIFPTETVYGIGADARSQAACLKIFQAKGRPSNNPLIVHLSSLQEAQDIAIFNEDAEKLSSLWPGPLTLVLPQKNNAMIAKCVTAGLNTIAVRIPAASIALDLIRESGCPIAAPSANKSGTLSSTTYEHVRKNFSDEIFVLSSNTKATYGLESTIIDLSSSKPTILRFGFITPDMIEKLLGKKVEIASKLSVIKAPGMLLKHYAPKTKLRLDVSELQASEVGLNFGNSALRAPGSMNLSPDADLAEAAANLFDYLHILDEFCQKNNIKSIAVSTIPNIGIGLAINDRLTRAAEVG